MHDAHPDPAVEAPERTSAQAIDYARRRTTLARTVKTTLIKALGLPIDSPDEIPDACPLFGLGLGLDSIDALEVVVAVEQAFHTRIGNDDAACLVSVDAIVDLLMRRNARAHAEALERWQEKLRRAYRQARDDVALVDCKAHARLEVSGPGALDALNEVVGHELRDLPPHRVTRTLVPSPAGTVDAIVWIMALEDRFEVICAPPDRAPFEHALEEHTRKALPGHVVVEDVGADAFALALVGPHAQHLVAEAFGAQARPLRFLSVYPLTDPPVRIARMSAIGEEMVWIFGPGGEEDATRERLTRAHAGETLEVEPEVLETLRIEHGALTSRRHLPTHVSVAEAGLGWMVHYHKPRIRGADALRRQLGHCARKAVLLRTRTPADEARATTVAIESNTVGHVHDTAWSPTLNETVAMAWIEHPWAVPGLRCTLRETARDATTISAPAVLSRDVQETAALGVE